ncbi:AAA family ATPase [Aeromonas hydrophila]|uniref:AAA family ATPase n=1 Tax=Aeromonas hydrophila TaxID=644 RepID=UPI002B461754|nr:AAA family ATPase [Aeromonas hydrophila]
MLTEFRVQRFRLFDDIKINKLSRVNLIVGKNNSGKSALLEALLLYFSNMSPTDLLEIVNARQENWSGRRDIEVTPLRHLFKGHVLPELFKRGFVLSSGKKSIEVRIDAYVVDEVDDDRIVRRPLTEKEFKDKGGMVELDDIAVVSIYKENGRSVRSRIMSVDQEGRSLSRRAFMRTPSSIPVLYVPTSGLSNIRASALWDTVSLTELENEVVSGLQLIEPSATGVTFVAESEDSNYRNRDGRIPLVKIGGVEEPIPLKSLGDGMTRMFHIILSLVCAKNGVLIVDEFENGLHWSVQEGAWDIVFKLSKQLNVQVFTTTHSRDCISSFSAAWSNEKEAGSFTRLSKRNDGTFVSEYSQILLSDSIDVDVEVR